MSRNVIFALMYHHHKLLDLIYYIVCCNLIIRVTTNWQDSVKQLFISMNSFNFGDL
jgi:hypothetical protein